VPGVSSLRHPLTRVLIVLTFSTGLIDAASYLGLGRVFTANMTGNVVLLGFGIAGAHGLPVTAPLVSLFAYLSGAVLAGRMRAAGLISGLAIEIGLLMIAACGAAILPVRVGRVSGDAVIAVVAFAMGVRATTVRRLGVPDLSTVVLTMTLTALAAGGAGTLRRSTAVVAMLLGAVAGALLVKRELWLPLAAAAALALVVGAGYRVVARRAG
jgi:uncharacterized membrane protein YoaK (UPF0700 family)